MEQLTEETGLTQKIDNKRRMALAAIHMAIKDLNMTETKYRNMLLLHFGVHTATMLPTDKLYDVISYLSVEHDWYPKNGTFLKAQVIGRNIDLLKKRIIDMNNYIPGGEKRVLALCRKFCGTDRVEWCNSLRKLKQLLAVLGNIYLKEVDMKRFKKD